MVPRQSGEGKAFRARVPEHSRASRNFSASAQVAALKDAAKDARSKPAPSRHDAKPKSRMEMAARSAKREIELSSRKRDAEKRKAEYMKGVGGGLKYTAVAMANRATATDVV